MKINTYPEMNGRIVNLLRICDTPIDLYAATRIEELEEQLKQAVETLKEKRDEYFKEYDFNDDLFTGMNLMINQLSSLSQGTEETE